MLATNSIPRMTGYDENTDEHAFLREYRQRTPLAISPAGFPLALRHAHLELLTNPVTTRQMETESLVMRGVTAGPLFEMFSQAMLFSNGDVHRRRRKPIARTFAIRLMEAMRGEVRRLAEEIIGENMATGQMDVLEDYAGAIPAHMIASILGVPAEDMPRFRRWVYSATRAFVVGFDLSLREEVERDIAALLGYCEEIFEDKRAHPQDDFLTHYLADAEALGEMTPEEVRWQLFTLIIGGTDTTRLAICATLSHLLQRPEQWQLLCADPEKWKASAAKEGLRYEPPIASFARVALEDIDAGGVTLPKDMPISVCTLSAMRDENVYAAPDRFDITRDDHPKFHPVFGAGAHRCLGEALAKVELEECLAAIAVLSPDAKLIGAPPHIRGLNGIRRIDRMEISLSG